MVAGLNIFVFLICYIAIIATTAHYIVDVQSSHVVINMLGSIGQVCSSSIRKNSWAAK